jgi:hypothetical protein
VIDKDECKKKTLHGGVFKHKEKKKTLHTWEYKTKECSNAYKLINRISTQHPFNCERKYLILMPWFMTIVCYKVIITIDVCQFTSQNVFIVI